LQRYNPITSTVVEDHPNQREACDIASIERQALSAICCGSLPPAEALRLVGKLLHYHWQEPEHATVFAAIRRVITRARAQWREELPAEATRMGFPDVEWTHYFAAGARDDSVMNDLTARLVGCGERKR
jgi:hypothetical protein